MASLGRGSFGNTSEVPGGGMVGNTAYQQLSPTSDPTFARLLEQIMQITPTALPGIESITQQGMNSPLLQLVLGPALQRLQAPQAQARQNLTEQTRAAGGLRGSTYGQDMNKLVANQGLQQNDLMAQVIQQVLGTLISGSLQSQQNSMLPGKSLTDVLRTIAPQTVTGSTGAGGEGGGGISGRSSMGGVAGTGVSPEDRDAMLRGFPSAEAMRFQQMLGAGAGTVRPTASPGVSAAAPSTPYTPYLDPLSGGSGGGWYDIGAGQNWLQPPQPASTTYPTPTPEWNPTTGAYQGGYQPETVMEGWW